MTIYECQQMFDGDEIIFRSATHRHTLTLALVAQTLALVALTLALALVF